MRIRAETARIGSRNEKVSHIKALHDHEGEVENESGIDTELNDMIARWERGMVDVEGEEFVAAFGDLPGLKLLARTYTWKNGVCYKNDSKEVVTPEAQNELLVQAQKDIKEGKQNNSPAVRALLEMRTSLVLFTLAKLRKRFSVEADDLFQEGQIGLLKAIADYNPQKGASFATYAQICVESRMRQYLENFERSVRLPRKTRAARRIYFIALRETKAELPDLSPDTEQFRALMAQKLAEKGIAAARDGVDTLNFDRWLRTYQLVGSSDEGVSEPDYVDGSMVSMTGDNVYPLGDTEESYLKGLNRKILSQSLRSLTPHEQLVLRMRFGLVDDEDAPVLFHTLAASILNNPDSKRELRELIHRVRDAASDDFNSEEFMLKTPVEKFLLSLTGKVPKGFPFEHELTLEEMDELRALGAGEGASEVQKKALRKLNNLFKQSEN